MSSAVLGLEDGSVFYGKSIGVEGESSGEIVFNTAMSGYQEILTDPSYRKQIITFTYPQIGNTGINPEDYESDKVWASGLVLRSIPKLSSNWRKKATLRDFLLEQNVVGIAEVDTRRLTTLSSYTWRIGRSTTSLAAWACPAPRRCRTKPSGKTLTTTPRAALM